MGKCKVCEIRTVGTKVLCPVCKEPEAKKYWHISGFDQAEIHFITEQEQNRITIYSGNWYGPFDTFTECKNDAIEYQRATVLTAQNNINNLKEIRAKDLKEEPLALGNGSNETTLDKLYYYHAVIVRHGFGG